MSSLLYFVAAAAAGVGCYSGPTVMLVNNPPARSSGATSDLAVPTACPIYAAGDYDTDADSLPYEAPVLFGCGVASTGSAYGLALGDGGTGAGMAVIPGGGEIGAFYQFDDSVTSDILSTAHIGASGDAALIHAWAAPVNINAPECCPEGHPENEIPVTVVAVSNAGILFSYGQFDTTTPLQVYVSWFPPDLFPDHTGTPLDANDARFYINAPPFWTPCGEVDAETGVCLDPQPPTQGAWPPL